MSIFLNILWPILGPTLLRYAVTIAGSAATTAAGYAINKWGLTPATVGSLAAGLTGVVGALISTISKNKNAASLIDRIPVREMLDAVANSASVSKVTVFDKNLARTVPAMNVVGPEGHSQPQI